MRNLSSSYSGLMISQTTNAWWVMCSFYNQHPASRPNGDKIIVDNFEWNFVNKPASSTLLSYWRLLFAVWSMTSLCWVREWLGGATQATNHHLNTWWPNLTMHICGRRERWANGYVWKMHVTMHPVHSGNWWLECIDILPNSQSTAVIAV